VSRVDDWQPSATRPRLAGRAALLRRAREFFAARNVLEVDTPLVVNASVSDVHIHSATVCLVSEPDRPAQAPAPPMYLHTSPEYAMKRLLAAGSGDIFQICHVVRGNERGRLHNPEFTLIEWYRTGFSLGQLMDEVDTLVRELLGAAAPRASERLSYAQAFVRELGLDPLTASTSALAQAAAPLGFHEARGALDRDGWLELLMSGCIGPRLGCEALTFVHSYPASQAALAQLDPADPRVAERFELYVSGIELANGFHELAAEPEQRARFVQDNDERRRRGLPVAPLDERFLASLAAGLPASCGVALGFDRLVMLATGATHIDEVLSFPTTRA
jgi:lysyl-tRNA synthetase class 2